jgi:molybdate transport system substrate-binding protein
MENAMRSMQTLLTAILACAVTLTAPRSFAQSGQIRLLCSNGIRAAVQQLMPAAEKAIGRKVIVEFSASTLLKKEIDAGKPFDLVIVTPGIIDDLANSGTLAPGSKTDIASSDLAVGIKAGSAKADVSTPDRMKTRLLTAKTLTWTDGGASAPAVLAMFRALGIAEQMKPKSVLQKTPGRPAESVAEGENELMFAPISEIQTVKGVEVLGKFPQEFQKPVVMTAGIAAHGKDAEGARKLVAYLAGPEAIPALKANGMVPARAKN